MHVMADGATMVSDAVGGPSGQDLVEGKLGRPQVPVVAHQLVLPVLAEGVIDRPRVVAGLQGGGMPVVVVTAPAGYGKTTALR